MGASFTSYTEIYMELDNRFWALERFYNPFPPSIRHVYEAWFPKVSDLDFLMPKDTPKLLAYVHGGRNTREQGGRGDPIFKRTEGYSYAI